MKLVALLIGLLTERLATQIFHWRELGWIDSFIDKGLALSRKVANWPATIPVLLLAFVLILPVLLVRLAIGDLWFGLPYFALAIVVLFFSLGPRDVGEEVDEYCLAIESDDEQRELATAKNLLEEDPPQDPAERTRAIEEAICIQANNRLFAVIFWFIVLGPLGAWLYRVIDLIRHRAVFNAWSKDDIDSNQELLRGAAENLHGLIAWVPARISAAIYGLAGNFEAAAHSWRAAEGDELLTRSERNERLLARVGTGAMALQDEPDEEASDRAIRGATAANGLVFRSLLIWALIIGAMTLYGWSVFDF
jgi:AmpE protein